VSTVALITGGLALAGAGAASAGPAGSVHGAVVKQDVRHSHKAKKHHHKKTHHAKKTHHVKKHSTDPVVTNPPCNTTVGPDTTVTYTNNRTCSTSSVLNVNGANVTVNVGHHALYGNGTNNNAINGENAPNLTVENGTISGFRGNGISVESDTIGLTVQGLKLTSLYDGIYAPDSQLTTVANNNITNDRYGIVVPLTVESMFTNNTMNNISAVGLFLVGGHLGMNQVTGNTFVGSEEDSVLGWQENDVFTGNTLPSSGIGAVFLGLDGTSTVANNTANNNAVGYLVGDSGNDAPSPPDDPLVLSNNTADYNAIGFLDGTDSIPSLIQGDVTTLTEIIDGLAGIQFDPTSAHPFVTDTYSANTAYGNFIAGFDLTQAATKVTGNTITVLQGFLSTSPTGLAGAVGIWGNKDTFSDIYNNTISGSGLNGAGILTDVSLLDQVYGNVVSLDGVNADGILVDPGCVNIWILSNTLNNNGNDGLYILNGVGGLITVSDNTANNNGGYGFQLESSALQTLVQGTGNTGSGDQHGTFDPNAILAGLNLPSI
jgi:hypothetical protein